MGTGELLGQPNKMLGVTWRWTGIPPRGSSNAPSRLHATETGISSGSLAPNDFTFTLSCLDKIRSHYPFNFIDTNSSSFISRTRSLQTKSVPVW